MGKFGVPSFLEDIFSSPVGFAEPDTAAASWTGSGVWTLPEWKCLCDTVTYGHELSMMCHVNEFFITAVPKAIIIPSRGL